MKNQQNKKDDSVATPILRDVTDRHKMDCQLQNPTLSEAESEPASLYQDDGSGYNANFVFPQE